MAGSHGGRILVMEETPAALKRLWEKKLFGIGTTEILIILAIALLLFGSRKLPDIGKGLGQALREFKNVQEDVKDVVSLDTKVHKNKEEHPKPKAGDDPADSPNAGEGE